MVRFRHLHSAPDVAELSRIESRARGRAARAGRQGHAEGASQAMAQDRATLERRSRQGFRGTYRTDGHDRMLACTRFAYNSNGSLYWWPGRCPRSSVNGMLGSPGS